MPYYRFDPDEPLAHAIAYQVMAREPSTSFPPQVKYCSLLRRVWTQTRLQNGNFILIIVGLSGTGKSWTSLRIAYDMFVDWANNPKFEVKRDICFSIKRFFERTGDPVAKGEAIILDESGIEESLQARNFMTSQNKVSSSLFQTIRFRNQLIILNLPNAKMLDVQVKSMAHAHIIMRGSNQYCSWGRVYLHNPDLWEGKLYTGKPRTLIDGEHFLVYDMVFNAPPKHILDVYEPMHQQVKLALQKKWSEGLNMEKVTFDYAFNKFKDIAGKDPQRFYHENGKFNREEFERYFKQSDNRELPKSVLNSIARHALDYRDRVLAKQIEL